MSADSPQKARRLGRWSILCLVANLIIVGLVTGWWFLAQELVGNSGNPPGPQIVFAALFLPVLAVGGVLYLGIAAFGAVFAGLGWTMARRLPDSPHAGLGSVAFLLHVFPPVLAVIGRQMWLWYGS